MQARKQLGFGTLQLLVVVAACGLVSSLVILISGGFASRTRDARRLSDMNQIRQGMELYYNSGAGYPDTSTWVIGDVFCGANEIMKIPKDPSPGDFYSYKPIGKVGKGCSNQMVWTSYEVQFHTETDTTLGTPGTYCLRAGQAISQGKCP